MTKRMAFFGGQHLPRHEQSGSPCGKQQVEYVSRDTACPPFGSLP